MTFTTILSLSLLGALVAGAVVALAIDLSRIAAKGLDRRRVRRESRRGWDWPAFEQDVARFIRERSGARHTAHRRR